MPAIVLSLTGAVILGGLLWVIIGSRLKLAKDPVQNDILNFLVFFVIGLAVALPTVWWIIG